MKIQKQYLQGNLEDQMYKCKNGDFNWMFYVYNFRK